jgi:hypothetical protein
MVPVEMEPDDCRLPMGRTGTHPHWALADAGLVDKDNQLACAPGFFLSPRQMCSFQRHTASSPRLRLQLIMKQRSRGQSAAKDHED